MKNRLVITILLLLLAFSSLSDSSQREEIPSRKLSHNMKMTVEDIRYIGDSKYKITISLMNISTETLRIEMSTPVISVQTDTIGTAGWIKTEVTDHIEPNFLLKPHGRVKKSFIIYIPLEKYDNLYKTYEGDISLKVEAEVFFKKGGSNGKMEEIYLWLRPGTNKWIHREGM